MPPPTGAPIARIVSRIVADTMAAHTEATAAGMAATKDSFLTGFMEKLETELRPIAGQVLGWMAESDTMPAHLKAAAAAAVGPEHQTDVLIQIIGIAAAMIGGSSHLAGPMVQETVNELWRTHANVPLSPSLLAEAYIKGVLDAGPVFDEAQLSGLNPARMETMIGAMVEAPGPMDLLAAMRRGIIDKDTFDKGVRQGHVSNEWIPMYHELRRQLLSPADLAQAAVQGHVDYVEAKAVAAQSGIFGSDFDILFEATGNPPGVNDIGELLNRGTWTMTQASAAMKESRTKPKYEQDVLSLREALPPREAIVLMVERGVVDVPKGVSMAMQLGYNRDNATFLVQEAVNRKLGTEKDLTKGEILSLYAEGFIDRATALSMVDKLGYSAEEAAYIVNLADTAIEHQARTAARSKVHSLFVSYRMDRVEASNDLDALGVRTEVRNKLLEIWQLEREANAKDLTKAELKALLSAGLIDSPTYKDRLIQLGYDPKDALMLLQLEDPEAI